MKSIVRFIACLIFILGLTISARAQFEDAVWDTITADTFRDILAPQGLATNGYEECHLAYAKPRIGGGCSVYYRFFDLYNGAHLPIVVDSTRPCYAPAIASRFGDDQYDIDILYESDDNIWRCSGDWQGGSWNCAAVTNTADPKFSPCVAWGGNYLHGAWITYVNSEYKIVYMKARSGQQTLIEVIQDSELGEFGSGAQPVIVAGADIPHIFYRGVNGANYHIHHAYKTDPDSAWQIEYLFTPNLDDFSVSVDDNMGYLQLAISGNEGWGFPGRVYYAQYNADNHQWSEPELATNQYSAVNASIVRAYSTVYIASCGVNGNIYNGDVYLSTKSGAEAFHTTLLGNFQSVTCPLITSIVGEYGVLIFDAPVNGDLEENIELIYYGPDIISSVHEPPTPSALGFYRSFPNPFNSRAYIEFGLENAAHVAVDIFDIMGRKIEALADRDFPAGEHGLIWNAEEVTSGVYFYRLQVDSKSLTGKMALLK
jgi:hypothetical protein